MNGSGSIYGLIDPRSGELRYVGKTCQPVRARLSGHIKEAREGHVTHRHNWLRQLLAADLKPEVEVLETHESADALVEAERHFITYFRHLGCNLTNLTDGGEGVAGYRHTQATKDANRRLHLGRRRSPETLARMSAALKAIGHGRGLHSDARRISNSRAQGGRAFRDHLGRVYQTQCSAARALSLDQGSVSLVLRGKQSSTHGFQFTYL